MNSVSQKMAKIAYDAAIDKKGEDIRLLDISGVSVLADYFVIVSGANDNQVQAIADNIEEELYKSGYTPRQIEGRSNGGWILMDYQDIIVHIFDKENRLFYDLERIWRDGKDISPETL